MDACARLTVAVVSLMVLASPCLSAPTIDVTRLPEWGTGGPLEGCVEGTPPGDVAIAVFIRVDEQWWMKPTQAQPLTPVADDGSFSVNIVTGGVDRLATEVAVLLVPVDAVIPDVLGEAELPTALLDLALARVDLDRAPREVEFAGMTWLVKASKLQTLGPGSNWFSDDERSVWVDDVGLHLTILRDGDRWLCSEVISKDAPGFGAYRLVTEPIAEDMPLNAVAGYFTWDDYAPDHHYREIDIEFGRWGEPEGDLAQYVVQPWERPGNMHRFSYAEPELTSHEILWTAEQVRWRAWSGTAPSPTPETLLHEWSYTGEDLHTEAGRAQLRLNLWLIGGEPPANGREVEWVIREFEFRPLQAEE